MPPNTSETTSETVNIQIRVPDPLWRRLGARAAMEATTRQALVAQALEQYLSEETEGGANANPEG